MLWTHLIYRIVLVKNDHIQDKLDLLSAVAMIVNQIMVENDYILD